MEIDARGMNKEDNAFGRYYKRPMQWGLEYIGVIIIFALIYLLIPATEWGGNESIGGFLDSLYFSVVTITSLGFGDTYPVAGSLVRILVIIEAITGILIIGFFLLISLIFIFVQKLVGRNSIIILCWQRAYNVTTAFCI